MFGISKKNGVKKPFFRPEKRHAFVAQTILHTILARHFCEKRLWRAKELFEGDGSIFSPLPRAQSNGSIFVLGGSILFCGGGNLSLGVGLFQK